ncbi:MAG TPA: pyridoxal-phosphate dependent enzyme [Phycisphaerae bacterium]|nr:pyridoxal-phosphate dependent enzyme [Phycisphaerae bacterium]HRW55362.1 pyridoxal-phosphate dependent enzyme [Phycisphaerae bacterium]
MNAGAESSATLPLFDRYPLLRDRVAWTPIGDWPTPILHADAFARESGLRSFHIKREDLSHPQCGGNKTRGLEFLIARARELRAECLVTFSSAGSHHIAKTAWHARRFGIDCAAVFIDQPASDYVRNNIAAALESGATYLRANRLTVVPKTALAYWRERRRRIAGGWRGGDSGSGRPVCFIAPGGTNRRSMLGHVNAALELKAQIDAGAMPAPDFIFVVLGSLGTAAGLALGLKLAGLEPIPITVPPVETR